MFDRQTTALIRPAIEALARPIVRVGIGADALTFTGLAVGWPRRSRCSGHWPARC
jgi:hypothetical protein